MILGHNADNRVPSAFASFCKRRKPSFFANPCRTAQGASHRQNARRATAPRRSCLQSKWADAGIARAAGRCGRFETSLSSLHVKSHPLSKSRERDKGGLIREARVNVRVADMSLGTVLFRWNALDRNSKG